MKIENGIYRLTSLDDVTVQLMGETVEGHAFTLNGETYVAYLDPDDGWRSYGYLEKADSGLKGFKPKNTFPPVLVEVVYEDIENYVEGFLMEAGWIISMVHPKTKEVILRIGTDYTDAFYPYGVCHWHPENITDDIKDAQFNQELEEQKDLQIKATWFEKELIEAIGEENADRVWEVVRCNNATILFN